MYNDGCTQACSGDWGQGMMPGLRTQAMVWCPEAQIPFLNTVCVGENGQNATTISDRAFNLYQCGCRETLRVVPRIEDDVERTATAWGSSAASKLRTPC